MNAQSPDDPKDPWELPEFLRRQQPPSETMKTVAQPDTIDEVIANAVPDEEVAEKRKPAKRSNVKRKAKPAMKKVSKTPTSVTLDKFGFRDGSLKSQAAAMAASEDGVTLAEMKEKLGSIQYNMLTELRNKGHTIKEKKEDSNGNRKATRYFLKAK